MKKTIVLILMLVIFSTIQAQRITHNFQNVTMPEALHQLKKMTTRYTINFIYDDLEDFHVTANIKNKNVPEAIRILIGFYPISLSMPTDSIISVECSQKPSLRYKGKIVDEKGIPVAYANVALLSIKDSTLLAGGVSNESGYFVIPCQTDKVITRITYVGYKTLFRSASTRNLGLCQLSPDHYSIKDVIVKGQRSTTQLKEGSLLTSIVNTPLANSSDMNELLQKIPGLMKIPGGSLETIYGGKPDIYINKHKVMSEVEITQLSPKLIKSIEVINNPGSKYNAETQAVVIIHTLQQEEHVWLYTNLDQQYGFYPNYSWDINLGIKQGKISASIFYDIEKEKRRVNQPVDETVTTNGNVYRYIREQYDCRRATYHNLIGNLEYEITKNHQVGIEYDGSWEYDNSYRNTDLIYYHDSKLQAHSIYDNNQQTTDRNHHLNFFYNGEWNDRFISDFNIDYINKNTTGNQCIIKQAEIGENTTLSNSNNRFQVYSTRLNTEWNISSSTNLATGIDASIVSGKGYLDFENKIFDTSNYLQKEYRAAAYFNLKILMGNFTISGGLRYELTNAKYIDEINEQASVNKTYRDLFPSLSISHSRKGWNHTLSLTTQIKRPSFRQLSDCSYYMTEYMYQKGNPLLDPTKTYRLNWTTQYRCLTVYARYIHQKNYIDNGFVTLANQPNIIVCTYNNYKRNQSITFGTSINKTFGCYYGSLQADLRCPFFDIDYLGETLHYRTPCFTLINDNIFTLPHNFIIDLYYMYCSGGNRSAISFEPFQNLKLSIKKSFYDKRLNFAFTANDILRSMKYATTQKIGYISNHQTEDYQEWYFGMKVTYSFNHRQKYKGISSAENEIRRL